MHHANRMRMFGGLLLSCVAMRDAAAQQAYQPQLIPGVPPMLERIEPRTSDVSPLREGLRAVNMQADMRMPIGFQHVYRVPGHDDLFMRVNGGIYAVFPQSVYTRGGASAPVPPGTIFSIGPPSQAVLDSQWLKTSNMQPLDVMQMMGASMPAPTERHPTALVTQADDRHFTRRNTMASSDEWTAEGAPNLNPNLAVGDERRYVKVRTTPPDPSLFLKTIVTDDAYRARRLAQLMEQAAQAVRDGS